LRVAIGLAVAALLITVGVLAASLGTVPRNVYFSVVELHNQLYLNGTFINPLPMTLVLNITVIAGGFVTTRSYVVRPYSSVPVVVPLPSGNYKLVITVTMPGLATARFGGSP